MVLWENTMKLIAFCGAAGSGKTTAIKLLSLMVTKHVNIKMAQPIYDLAKAFGWDGEKDSRGRKLLQEIGDVARGYNEDWLINTWIKTLIQLPPQNLVTCDAIRCTNDGEAVRYRGGQLVTLIGMAEDLGDNATHCKEQGIADEKCDLIIHNDGTMCNFSEALKCLI